MNRPDPIKEQIHAIPMDEWMRILGHGHLFEKQTKTQARYKSPLRDEKTGSFWTEGRMWKDYGHHLPGGDVFDLYCDLHGLDRRSGYKQAREALKGYLSGVEASGPRHTAAKQPLAKREERHPVYKLLREPGHIWMPSLKDEVARRGLSKEIVSPYLRHAWVENSENGKRYNGLAFQNDAGGWEISVPINAREKSTLKMSTVPKGPTSFKGTEQGTARVFEGWSDYLTWLELQKTKYPIDDCYVLNSLSFTQAVADSIIERGEELQKVILMLDNDAAGIKAAHVFNELLEPTGLRVGTQNHLYDGINARTGKPYKDLSEWWMEDPAARKREGPTPDVKQYNDSAWAQLANRRAGPGLQ